MHGALTMQNVRISGLHLIALAMSDATIRDQIVHGSCSQHPVLADDDAFGPQVSM